MPKVLIIILKRFERRQVRSRSRGGSLAFGSVDSKFSLLRNIIDLPGSESSAGGMRTEKIDNFIDFPLDGLDLGPYCAQSSEEGGGGTLFDLFAVCNHYGRAGFGHYTALCREWKADDSLGDQWLSYDDDQVRPVRAAEVKSNSAYILFYRQRGGQRGSRVGLDDSRHSPASD